MFRRASAPTHMASVLATFNDYPQRQKAATFNLDEVLQEMKENGGSK